MSSAGEYDMTDACEYFLIDIDNTLTRGRPGAPDGPEPLHGNFLFPVIRDLMTECGWERGRAEKAIGEYANDVVFWDYPDFLAEFRLPAEEAYRRMREWHRLHLEPCPDGVALVKRLHGMGKSLFIMSNNPYVGCMFKLQAAGLASDEFGSPYFRRVFGTNTLRGCKNDPAVWRRALALIPADPALVCTAGDDPHDDGEVPRSVGIAHSIILKR